MRRVRHTIRARRFDERGALGGLEGLVFGVLVFVFGTLVIVYAWSVIDAKIAVTAASREAARAYVESTPDEALAAADDAARAALLAHRRPYVATPQVSSPDFERCGRVQLTVSTKVHRVGLPLLRQTAGDVVVSANHVEYIDPYRSGLEGAANCPTDPR